jgi:hypothetical protein
MPDSFKKDMKAGALSLQRNTNRYYLFVYCKL